ncbi:MAG: hypothetical protein A2341_00020 [Deltaproteobacteria bacterium RIFOXYB12_FULL_58_9]|nr:MAG: hypothetical protein A2341_00020 [Deltaproteobacteria bacterium RIFOXYB12_FULL_58_9]
MYRQPLLITVLTLTLAACSDVRLEYPDEPEEYETVDNEMSIAGEFCTSMAGNVEYPVKIMFVVDGSGSQQFTDQNRQRVVAVEETINALIGLGTTYFKVVVFNASITSTPPVARNCEEAVFTNSVDELANALNNLAEADTLTDYQGALAVAYDQLQLDMSCAESPAELARTKYVVIFVSDGMPDPQCTIGLGNDFDPVNVTEPYLICESSNFVNCILKRDLNMPGGTRCDTVEYGTCGSGAPGCAYNDAVPYCCDTDFEEAGTSSALFGGVLGDSELEGGNDYNQPYQILEKVESIMELQDRYQVGELRVHAGLVLDPLADPAVIEIFGDAAQAAPLMRQVADLGAGQYMEFYGGDSIDFLQINFDAIKQQRVIRGFFVDNRSYRLTAAGNLVDSDMDGLTDDEEHGHRTKPDYADSDGDGYSDFVEVRMRGFSFDPLDPCYPPIDDATGDYRTRVGDCAPGDVYTTANTAGSLFPCAREELGLCSFAGGTCSMTGFADRDRDGLHDCEERAIGTDPQSPDSDRDGIPDLQEFIYGTDLRKWDSDRDDDKDGLANGIEIEWHLNPTIQQNEQQMRERYRYSRPEIGKTVDGRSCYSFAVRRVQMGYTGRNQDYRERGETSFMADNMGYNQVRLYILENMADNLSGAPLIRTACVTGQYVPPSRKVPAAGGVRLDECDFWYLANAEAEFQNNQTIPDPACGRTAVTQFNPNDHCILLEQ